jgi:hypothetical protein
MEDEKLKCIVKDAVGILLEKEGEIIKKDINELTITHKLAVYLQRRFRLLSVDICYNRNIEIDEYKPKYIGEGKYGIPDIVIHERLTNKRNLLVIEIKKQDNKEGRDEDRKKLEALTTIGREGGYNFQLGLFLDISIKEAEPIYSWYKNGKVQE